MRVTRVIEKLLPRTVNLLMHRVVTTVENRRLDPIAPVKRISGDPVESLVGCMIHALVAQRTVPCAPFAEILNAHGSENESMAKARGIITRRGWDVSPYDAREPGEWDDFVACLNAINVANYPKSHKRIDCLWDTTSRKNIETLVDRCFNEKWFSPGMSVERELRWRGKGMTLVGSADGLEILPESQSIRLVELKTTESNSTNAVLQLAAYVSMCAVAHPDWWVYGEIVNPCVGTNVRVDVPDAAGFLNEFTRGG